MKHLFEWYISLLVKTWKMYDVSQTSSICLYLNTWQKLKLLILLPFGWLVVYCCKYYIKNFRGACECELVIFLPCGIFIRNWRGPDFNRHHHFILFQLLQKGKLFITTGPAAAKPKAKFWLNYSNPSVLFFLIHLAFR